jgi:hypothetical protein
MQSTSASVDVGSSAWLVSIVVGAALFEMCFCASVITDFDTDFAEC